MWCSLLSKGGATKLLLLTRSAAISNDLVTPSIILDLCIHQCQIENRQVIWIRSSKSQNKPMLHSLSLCCNDSDNILHKINIKYVVDSRELRRYLLNFHLLKLPRFALVVDDMELLCGEDRTAFIELSAIANEIMSSTRGGFVAFSITLPQPMSSTSRLASFFQLRIEQLAARNQHELAAMCIVPMNSTSTPPLICGVVTMDNGMLKSLLTDDDDVK